MGMLLIILVAAGVVAGVWMFARRTAGRAERRRERVQDQDVLKHLYHLSEKHKTTGVESLSGSLHRTSEEVTHILQRLADRRLVTLGEENITLTDKGRESALGVVRSHRLWERYLADRTGVDENAWHNEAEKAEHALSSEQIEALARSLGHPVFDPHGDPIPQPGLDPPELRGGSLARASKGAALLVVHVEDEPATVYAELTAKGILPGVRLQVLARDEQEIVVEAEGARHSLTPLVAGNVTVSPTRLRRPTSVALRSLSDLAVGSEGRVAEISPAVHGLQRRRLLDLGLVPGTIVRAEFTSPGGDPTAYSIRGALVALRRTEAAFISIENS